MQRRRAAGRVIGRRHARARARSRWPRARDGRRRKRRRCRRPRWRSRIPAWPHIARSLAPCNSWPAAMNIAHLLLGAAQEFRDITALARGDAVHLGYRDLWRKVSVMSTHLAARFGLPRGDRVAFAMTNCVEFDRGHVRDLACRPLRGADERQAACQGVRLHPGEFRRQALLRDARPRRDHRRGGEGGAGAEGDRRCDDARLHASWKWAIPARSPTASRPTRRGCSTPRAPPAGPRARCSAIATCWP